MIKNKKGFTLIELIIVMAIIGILAVVAIVAISGKTVDARNARRMADISAVRTALAINCAESTTGSTLDVEVEVTPLVSTTEATEDMVFTNVTDPDGTAPCDDANAATCDYAYADPADGQAYGVAPTTIDSCEYHINFYLEGKTDGDSTATQDGLTPGV